MNILESYLENARKADGVSRSRIDREIAAGKTDEERVRLVAALFPKEVGYVAYERAAQAAWDEDRRDAAIELMKTALRKNPFPLSSAFCLSLWCSERGELSSAIMYSFLVEDLDRLRSDKAFILYARMLRASAHARRGEVTLARVALAGVPMDQRAFIDGRLVHARDIAAALDGDHDERD